MYVNINYTTIDYRPFIIKYLITQSFGFIKIYVLVKIVGLALLTILKTISKNWQQTISLLIKSKQNYRLSIYNKFIIYFII